MDDQYSSAGILKLQFTVDVCKISIEYECDAIETRLDANLMGITLLSNDLAFEEVSDTASTRLEHGLAWDGLMLESSRQAQQIASPNFLQT